MNASDMVRIRRTARAPLGAAAALLLTASCGSGNAPAAPTGAPPMASPPQNANVGGAWTGTANDSQGATKVTWSLTQTGTAAEGTVKTEAIDPTDGSCNSCHRNKSGTFSATISGTTLTLTMFFAAGVNGDPTPACTATLTGTASQIDAQSLAATYSGADSCEGPFLNGTLLMTRHQ